MKKKLLICLLLIVACKDINDDFKDRITKKNNFWVFFWQYPILNKDSISKNPIYGTRFLDSGEIKNLSRRNGTESEVPNFENVYNNKSRWTYIAKDSTFSFYGYDFKTIRLVKDTIVVINKKTKKTGCFINYQ